MGPGASFKLRVYISISKIIGLACAVEGLGSSSSHGAILLLLFLLSKVDVQKRGQLSVKSFKRCKKKEWRTYQR